MCFIGSYDHNVYALDAATGREIWRYPTGDGVFATPAVVRVDGRACVLAASSDRTLYCIDARQGVKIWGYETYDWRPSLGQAFLASPIVVEVGQVANLPEVSSAQSTSEAQPGQVSNLPHFGPSVILVSWVYDTAPRRATEIAEVRAIAPDTGRLRWKRPFAESRPTHPAWGVRGGTVRLYVGCRDGNLYCLDAAGGGELWRRASKFPIDATPVFVAGAEGETPLVLVGSKFGDVRAFAADSGEPVWSFKAGHWIDATPAIVRGPDGAARALVGSYDGRLYCLDARTGVPLWRYATRGNVIASAAVVPRGGEGGRFDVFVPSDDDMLHAVDGVSGRGIWQFSPGPFLWAYRGLGDTIWASPAAARLGGVDMLIVPHYDGRIHAYRLDRSVQWLPATGDPAYGRAMLARIGASMLATLALALAFVSWEKRKWRRI